MDTGFREGQALRGPNPAHSEFATRPLDTLPTVRLSETATNVQTLLAKRGGERPRSELRMAAGTGGRADAARAFGPVAHRTRRRGRFLGQAEYTVV